MTSNVSPSSPAAPETPAQKPPSRKTLYLILGGVCVFLCLCLCLVATVAGVYGLSTLSSGSGLGGGHRAANATWQIDVKSIRSSMTGISDSTGGSVAPKSGYTFIIVTATVKNVSGASKSFFLSAGNSDAKLEDKNGDPLDLAAVKKGDSVNINFANQVQMMFVYADQETWEFYFVALENDRGPFTFTFMDLSPLGPLSLP